MDVSGIACNFRIVQYDVKQEVAENRGVGECIPKLNVDGSNPFTRFSGAVLILNGSIPRLDITPQTLERRDAVAFFVSVLGSPARRGGRGRHGWRTLSQVAGLGAAGRRGPLGAMRGIFCQLSKP